MIAGEGVSPVAREMVPLPPPEEKITSSRPVEDNNALVNLGGEANDLDFNEIIEPATVVPSCAKMRPEPTRARRDVVDIPINQVCISLVYQDNVYLG